MQTCGISRIFQSTLPARGATFSASPRRIHSPYFNPRSPHGERHRGCFRFGNTHIDISIHAPRTGSDATLIGINHFGFQFQSTLPARGATSYVLCEWRPRGDFNPRSPHGERLPNFSSLWSTIGISIHAPRTGSDRRVRLPCAGRAYFNPRSPHGERPA